MKVQLVANLAANGELVLAEHSAAYAAPQEVAGMGFAKAMVRGNIVLGRTTYEMFAPLMKDVFAALDTVVLTGKEMEGVHCAANAEDAITYLENKGYEAVCVVGGTKCYNAFLEKGLADELFFNLFPIVINGGGALESAPQITNAYKLADCSTKGDIVQLHYVKA